MKTIAKHESRIIATAGILAVSVLHTGCGSASSEDQALEKSLREDVDIRQGHLQLQAQQKGKQAATRGN